MHTIRLHIIVYYEIIIYRLVEGNIIATLSSRGREKSQFFFSITFRNYHVVLWSSDRFFEVLQSNHHVYCILVRYVYIENICIGHSRITIFLEAI